MHHEIDSTPEPQRRPVLTMHEVETGGPGPGQDRVARTPTAPPVPGPPGARVGATALALSASTSGFLIVAYLVGAVVERGAIFVPLTPLLLAGLAPLLLGPCAVVCAAAALHPGTPRRQGMIGAGLVALPLVLFALQYVIGLVLILLPHPAW